MLLQLLSKAPRFITGLQLRGFPRNIKPVVRNLDAKSKENENNIPKDSSEKSKEESAEYEVKPAEHMRAKKQVESNYMANQYLP